jgi:hypothetical protein
VSDRTALWRSEILKGFAKNRSALIPGKTDGSLPLIKITGIEAVWGSRFNCRMTVAPDIPGETNR